MSPEIPHSEEQEPEPTPFTLEEVVRVAKETTLQDGWHMPTVLADDGRVSVVLQMTEMGKTHQERVAMMNAAGFALGKSDTIGQLEQVFFITEAWMSMPPGGELTLPPSQDPNRIEVLLISQLEVAERRGDLVMFEMIRDGEQLVDLKEFAPRGEKDLSFDSPLLDAFANGFQMGRGMPDNSFLM